MKRAVALITVIALMLPLLGGCSSPDRGGGSLEAMGWDETRSSPAGGEAVVAYAPWTPQAGLDVGGLVLDAPAGKHGFVQGRDGQFVFGDTGERVRFWGVNMAFSANFPATRERAEAVADDLAGMGFNLVRLHGFDSANGASASLFQDYSRSTLTLDPAQLDRLNYFVSVLKSRGIYIDLNLTSKRVFTPGDGVEDPALVSAGGQLKSLQLMDPTLIRLQQEFATALLTHRNPYTGLTYAQEPAIAMLEPNNELSLYRGWLDGSLDAAMTAHYSEMMDERWNAFLREKYGTDSALRTAWTAPGEVPGEPVSLGSVPWLRKARLADYSSAAQLDFSEFLYRTEADYYEEMRRHLRELGAVQPVSGNNQYSGLADLAAGSGMDFTNSHYYFDHPQFSDGWSTESFTMHSQSLVRTGVSGSFQGNFYGMMAFSAVEGMPHVVSEWGHPFPNPYEYESPVLTAAVARLQDWDAMILFAYSHWNAESDCIEYWFDIQSNPVKRAQMPAAALLFIRGDVDPLTRSLVLDYTMEDTLRNGLLSVYNYSLFSDRELPPAVIIDRILRRGRFDADATTKVSDSYNSAEITALQNARTHTAPGGQLTWHAANGGREYVVIDTPRLQSFVGFIAEQELAAGNFSVKLEAGNDAAVTLVSLTGEAIPRSEVLLLTVCGQQRNQGQVADGHGGLGSWGSGGVEVQTVRGQVTLSLDQPEQYQVYALDSAGVPGEPLAVEYPGGGVLRFPLTEPTLWYQIIREG